MRKKLVIYLLLVINILMVLSSCSKDNSKVHSIPAIEGFSNDALTELAKYGNVTVLNETGFDEIDTSKYKIVYVEVSPKDRAKIVLKLKKFFIDKDYQVFYTSLSIDNSPERVCLINSKDIYDGLRAFKTNGINYDIDTDTLIEKLKIWDDQYKIDIVGIDGDWVDFSFENLPGNISELANEIYSFCPDSVDQGVGDITELEKIIKNDKEIFLWWD